MKEIIGLVAVALTIIGHVPYITDTLRGKTKPHAYTWVVWAVVTLLVFFGQWASGGGAGSWTTGMTGLITILIALLALKFGTRDVTRLDTIFFIAALTSIVPWYLTKSPTISIVVLTIIDVLAFMPTLRKTVKDPSSETLFTYALNVVRHGLSILALGVYSMATFLYPVTLLVMNIAMTVIIVRSRYKNR